MATLATTPIETTILNDIKSKLQGITKAKGYDFNVGTNGVKLYEVNVATIRQDTVSVVRRTTDESYEFAMDTVQYEMVLQVGFAHQYKGENPQQRANLFISNIRRVLGYDNTIAVVKTNDVQIPNGQYILERKGSAMNVTDPVPGIVHGQVDYLLVYRTAISDDRRVAV